MIALILALASLGGIAAYILMRDEKAVTGDRYGGYQTYKQVPALLAFLCWVVVVVCFIGLIICAILAIDYTGARYKADVINREYGANYTQQEIFYASSVIDTIRELDRKRYEINGDIRRQRDPQRNLPNKDSR